jgi:translation initiation factor 2 subunit 3
MSKSQIKDKSVEPSAERSENFLMPLSIQKQQLPPIDEVTSKLLESSNEQAQLQPTFNIGMIGHVAHGKTSLVNALSGVHTIKSSKEKIRNITIKLGYANFKVFKCDNLLCPPPECYQSYGSSTFSPKCKKCSCSMTLIRHMSFVDCPGHEKLMRTMLNGCCVMDAAILMIASNETVPQPQTAEHLVAAEIMGLKNIITVQNKVDLIPREQAFRNKKEISTFLKRSIAEDSPVIPISCALNFVANIDVLLHYLVKKIPTPNRDLTSPAMMKIIRSFDVNKPGTLLDDIKGGVCGGSILRGILRVDELVEIRPGIVKTDENGKLTWTPIITKVVSLFSENNRLSAALPGGLIAVGTKLDPSLTCKDRLVGHVLGRMGTLPDVFISLEVKFTLMKRVVGENAIDGSKVLKPSKDEVMVLNVGSASVSGRVIGVDGRSVRFILSGPVCTLIGEKISLSRNMQRCWRLVGWGTVTAGKPATLVHMAENN